MVDVDRSQLSLAIPNGRDIASNPREWPLSGFFFFSFKGHISEQVSHIPLFCPLHAQGHTF